MQPEEQVFSEVLQNDGAAGHGVSKTTKTDAEDYTSTPAVIRKLLDGVN